MNQALRPYGLT